MLGIGDRFPEFKLNAVSGNMLQKDPDWKDADHEFITVDNWSLRDWSVIYFYPKDFTFICPTEIFAFEKVAEQENCSVYGISPDNEYCHLEWLESNPTLVDVSFPLLADSGNMLAEDLEIVSEENVPYRATYIVDPEGIIQHASANALDTGRDIDEIIRTLHALRAGGLTGCSWTAGDEFVA